MSSQFKTQLKNKISIIFTFLRNTFKDIDKDIYNQLNEEYEEELLILAGMIPSDWISGFYDTLEMVIDIASCIDVKKMADVIENHEKARLWFPIDSYELFMNNCVIDKGWGKQAEKAVENICNKFRPIFNAIDKLFANPNKVLRRISNFVSKTDENNDILNNLI